MNTTTILALALVAIALDVVTTLICDRRGGQEMNRVVRWLMSRIGVAPALVVTHGIYAALVGFTAWKMDPWALIALAAMFWGVVMWNAAQLIRAR